MSTVASLSPDRTKRDLLQVRVWGARGSVPTPQQSHVRVGGNTSCVEVRVGDERLVFDAGTGLRALGQSLQGEAAQAELNLFLTHLHWDHIQGLPFFEPLYQPGFRLTIHSALAPEKLRKALAAQMAEPYFPVRFDSVSAELGFRQLADEAVMVGGAEVRSFALHHPGGAHGYVVSAGGARVVYATDHEHGNAAADAGLLEASRGADLLLYDAHYTPEEYETRRGWGHSTWSEAVKLAARAGVRQLALFHHHPEHADDAMEAILEQAQREFPATSLAREGETFAVGER